jgi:colicin import membrane protein
MKNMHPMALLLKYEGYPPAVIASLFMHLGLLLFIFGREVDRADFVTIEDPVIVAASAIDVNPQRLRRLERLELERAEADRREQARREREQQAQREQREREEAEQRRQQEEAARRRQEGRAREEALLQEQQLLAREQAARDAQASELAGEQPLVAEYVTIIRRVISQNWVIPPGARNGMTAIVRLQVVPTGEVVGTFIVESSGNSSFDRSVIQAVERAERFSELQNLDTGVFERNFRNFELVFRPEDLLR